MDISNNNKFSKFSKLGDKFFHSNLYILIVTLAGILGFATQHEIIAIYFIVLLTTIGWIVCEDLLQTFVAMAIVSMVPLTRYAQVGYFAPLYYIPIPIAIAFILHMIIFPIKIKLGRFFVPTLAVSIAITLGGAFYLSWQEYFSMPALYYVVGLGFGLLLINVIIESGQPQYREKNTEFFAKMMACIGIMGISMIAYTYIKNLELLKTNTYLFATNFQFGNNLSNILLLAMPFAFYLATRGKYSVFYYILGTFEYLALVLSLSRGGILFGTFIYPFVAISAIIVAKKDKKKLIITLISLILVSLTIFLIFFLPIISDIPTNFEISSSEARINLYKLAFENFLTYPIFGTGLAYNPHMYYFPQSMCIYWYHSTLFQIIGSLGIVGIIAYIIQFIYRIKTITRVKSVLNLFVFFAALGFGGYSMVNVGYFIPFPCLAVLLQMYIITNRNNNFVKTIPDYKNRI
jgi:hypothetical protein